MMSSKKKSSAMETFWPVGEVTSGVRQLLTFAAFMCCLLTLPTNAETAAVVNGKGGGTLLNLPTPDDGERLDPTDNGIQYHGGPIMLGTPNIYFIWYGNWAGNTAVPILTDWANNIGGSPYYNINTTYYNGSGTHLSNSARFAGSAFDAYSHGTALSDANVRDIVAGQITGGTFPADPNGVYFVLTSADVSETSGFCSVYCGWHTFGQINGTNIKYSFVGNADRCPSACAAQYPTSPNNNAGADAMASVLAHEFEETTSDPNLNAWYDTRRQENADKCAWTFGTEYRTPNGARANMRLGDRDFLIQQNWVNADGGYCALSYGGASCLPELGDYQPYLVAQPNGIVDVFWRTASNTLGHKWYVGGTWYGPEDLGGSLTSDPSPVMSSAGVLDVFWKGTDGNLWHKWYVNGWNGPESLGAGPLGSGPHAAGQSTGTIDVFWIGTDGQLWHEWYVGGAWYGPEGLGGSLASEPSPVVSSDGVLDVFWKGTDGNLWHKWYVNGWNGPESLGAGPLGSGPHAAGQSTGTIDVFWIGTDGQLWHEWYVGGAWYGPEGLGGSLASEPSPVVSSASVLDVFWKGTDSNLWHKWYVNGWYGPESLGAGPLGSAPSAAGQPTGTIDVFWKGTDSQLWHEWYVGGSWYGPEFQGCP
jgi:hypothetical protein